MRKLFFIGFLFFCFTAAAQTKKIDSLKRLLPTLQDTARVNRLIDLGWKFNGDYIHSDSINKYADMALLEAAAINYTKGKARALDLKSHVAGWLLGQNKMAEQFARQCLEESQKTNSEEDLGGAYARLGVALSVLGRFDSALILMNRYKQMAGKKGDYQNTFWASYFLSTTYSRTGEYWESFEHASKAIKIAEVNLDTKLKGWTTELISRIYGLTGDYKNQLQYAFDGLNENKKLLLHPYGTIGNAYLSLGQYDSAMYYQQQYLLVIDSLTTDEKIRKKFRTIPLGFIGSIHLAKKEYDKVISFFKEDLVIHKAGGNFTWTLQALYHLAKAYGGKKQFDSALLYARQVFLTASKAGQKEYTRDGSQVLASVFEQLKQTDSAYFYFKQYSVLKDSMAVEQVGVRMAFYTSTAEAENKIGLLNKDKEIQKQQLKKESQAKKFLMGGLAALILLGFIFFRNIALKRKNEKHRRELAENELQIQKLESERTKAELQQQATELEMQALRAQMNPHFIFNCLSSINRFILKNESEAASDYLTKFSRLIRMVLNNSNKPLIILEDELEMLRLYLDLERLRFKNSFDYSISFYNHFDISSIFIPPLLLQPFAENAIWHGLMQKDGQGVLEIAFELENNVLNCYITDNGIGRKAAAAIKSKSVEKPRLPDGQEKSMGMQITANRLALLNNDIEQTSFDIEDLVDEKGQPSGTRVRLKIKYKESTEEFSLKNEF